MIVCEWNNFKASLAVFYITVVILGISRMGYSVAERGFLLRFSERFERETYTGYFNLVKASGDTVSPLIISLLLFFGSYKLTFGVVALGMSVIIFLVTLSI